MNRVTEQDRERAREIAAQVISHECVDDALDREMLEAFRGDPKAAQSFADDFMQRAGSAGPCQHIISAIAQALADAREEAKAEAAEIARAMRPTGGRQWTDQQLACYEALTACADAILASSTDSYGSRIRAEIAEAVGKLRRMSLTIEDEIACMEERPTGRFLFRDDVLAAIREGKG